MTVPFHPGSTRPHFTPPADVILCVDDDPLDAFLLQEIAAIHGATIEVLHAYDDQEAIDLLLGAEPALLLVNTTMSTPGWAERLQRLRDASVDVPVLAWGAPVRSADVHKAMDAGAAAYLAKPTAPDMQLAVMAELWYWLRLRQPT